MELLDSSMDKIADKVYNKLKQDIPEEILGKMTVSVSTWSLQFWCNNNNNNNNNNNSTSDVL